MPVLLLFLSGLLLAAQTPPAEPARPPVVTHSDYKVDIEHPRLLLPARRLRLLQRERERQSLRWTQFDLLVSGRVDMPEKGFAYALYYRAADSETHGRQAIEWAIGPATDLRQIALVFDWCQPLLTPQQSTRLIEKLRAGLQKTAAAQDVSTVRSRVLAAVALSGHVPQLPEETLRNVVESWWKTAVLAPILRYEPPFDVRDHFPLIEMFHVLRDSFDIDLRETAPKFFTTLPVFHLLAHYPATYPAPENDYRIPLMKAHGEPDLRDAMLTRAAAFAMVAYDTNSTEMQFLQGWLLHDRFLMRAPMGVPYEFLWANPYQPGLSFHYLPNIFHDPPTGRLIIRSSWDDDAVWLYQGPGVMQMFQDGRVINLKLESIQEAVNMGNTVLLPGNLSAKFQVATEEITHYYVIGLKPSSSYEIEVEDQEMEEFDTDRGGVLPLHFPANRKAAARLRERPAVR